MPVRFSSSRHSLIIPRPYLKSLIADSCLPRRAYGSGEVRRNTNHAGETERHEREKAGGWRATLSDGGRASKNNR